MLLQISDEKRFGKLIKHLKEGMQLGRDEYPKNVTSMFELMYKFSQSESQQRSTNNRGFLFLQQDASGTNNESPPISGNDGNIYPEITCYNCGNWCDYAVCKK